MKAIMYHYVRPDDEAPPRYYHLGLDDFRRQLDHFEREYGFVERDRFLAAASGEADPPTEGVVLTFDDGLVDHHEWVLPELRERGLWGIFYVPTGPLADDSLLDVHRIHTLLGTYGGETVLAELEPRVSEDMIPDGRIEEFREETYTRQDNTESTDLVKRILNYYVTEDHRTALLDELLGVLSEADVPTSSVDMTDEQLRDLADAGMVVGSHTISHPVLANRPVAQQEREIVDSFAHLEETLDGLGTRTFCYPYGGFHTFTDETVAILEDTGSAFSFNVESRDIAESDLEESPQALPRYDCNEFPHGDVSGTLG
jgi:peptidoglycan/xylan/chitin deacetylase (PgdA/CDA1 family)